LTRFIDNFLADCFFKRFFIYVISSISQDNHEYISLSQKLDSINIQQAISFI
jgi:hypothetical protein